MATHTMQFSEENGGATVEFNCRFRSRPTDSAAEKIIEAIGATDETEQKLTRLFAYIVTCTRSLTFNANGEESTDAWEQLQNYWRWLETYFYRTDGNADHIAGFTLDPALMRESWALWESMVAPFIQEHWSIAFTKAQQVLPGKRQFLPNELLTVAELTDPDFLALRKPS